MSNYFSVSVDLVHRMTNVKVRCVKFDDANIPFISLVFCTIKGVS